MNPKTDLYLAQRRGRCPLVATPKCKVNFWRDEMKMLRAIIHDTELKEELKWSVPCYTSEKKNILVLSAFNDYCSISFFKGALLKDPHGILEKPGENTQSARLIKFTNVEKIHALESILKEYIAEAIGVEKAGLKVDFKKASELEYPEEFLVKLDESPELRAAFQALTPGRQKGYYLHFSGAKQSKTRLSRIEKCIPKILNGKGLNN